MTEEEEARFTATFGQIITPKQIDGYDRIRRRTDTACFGSGRDNQIAYILATAWWESAKTLQAVREGLADSDAGSRAVVAKLFEQGRIKVNYALPAANGQSFYGRGLVQLTWERNYRAIGDHLIGDPNLFYDVPDRVLDPELSAIILVRGMLDGIFTEYRLADFIDDRKCDFFHARQVVNRMDRAETLADLAEKFLYVNTSRTNI